MTGGDATTVADVLARAIAERAADRVFAFPGGGSNLDLIEALGRHGVEVVLARSEGGAALMAAAYADLSGRPAVLLVGLGPGVANCVNGVAHAYLDQSPLLVVSDRFGADELGTSGHQLLDHAALLAPVTKWQTTMTPATAATAVAHALSVAGAPPRGPVHVELPRDVAAAQTPPAAAAAAPRRRGAVDGAALAAAAAATTSATWPVVLVGDEARGVAQEQLVGLAERLAAPVLTSYKGKGAFPEDHPLWCGVVTNGALETTVLDRADAILAVGLDPVELLPRRWRVGAPVTALREHREAAPGYAAEHVVVGELPALVDRLAARLGDVASAWTAGAVGDLLDEQLDALRVTAGDTLTALEVVEAVRAVAPRHTIVTVDAGAHMLAASWGWRALRPQGFLISNGLATMGFAVPAAVAAALRHPQDPVVALTGDGGLLMHGAELETAVRSGARVVVVVLNDSSLSLIRIKQEDRGHARAAVDFGLVDAAAFARALGAHAEVADTAAEVRAAVTDALGRRAPTVVDVRISGNEYAQLQHVLREGGTPRRPACLS